MGGFTINGCGAADSYYPIKDLHTSYCASCGRERMFALMELKRKVKVFYIPTFSVGSKYAVVCSHCKDGWYVSDMQKDFILSHPADSAQIGADGVQLLGLEEPAPQPELPMTIPTPAKVCSCGAELSENAIFCSQCGKRWEAPAIQTVQTPQPIPEEKIAGEMPDVPSVDVLAAMRKKKICPDCRMMFPMERQVCPICDTPLEEKN